MTPAAVRTISEISSVLRDIKDRPMSVEGHTDSVGTVLYNKQLSSKRAGVVASELGKYGINQAKLKIRGLGEGYPIATNNSDAGRSRNRRVEIIVENN
jgi:outer membrane protein OmpA-like peptidoglycan-associated protein